MNEEEHSYPAKPRALPPPLVFVSGHHLITVTTGFIFLIRIAHLPRRRTNASVYVVGKLVIRKPADKDAESSGLEFG
jgi:hypothetical protein